MPNEHAASLFLPHPHQHCWRAFVDVGMLPRWVPGLRRAHVVTRNAEGLPEEVAFEFGDTLSYSLIYRYEAEREVRWEPRVGRRDGVAGVARFEGEGEGCRFTYELHPASPHVSRERAAEDPTRVVAAFAAWLRHSLPKPNRSQAR